MSGSILKSMYEWVALTFSKKALAEAELALDIAKDMRASKQLTTQAALNLMKGEELASQIAIAAAWAAANPLMAIGGLAAAGAVAYGLYSLMNQSEAKATGDLAMPAIGGGPIIANPREGTIFQGTANDEVAMAPGILGQLANSNNTATTSTNIVTSDNSEVASLLKILIQKVDQPTQVVVGNKVIDELNTQATLKKTYNTRIDSGYGTFG
jgi:hypothetical protein